MEENIKRIVVKVGTNVLTNKDNRIQGPILRELVRQIAVLYERDIQVILVSSGSAIALAWLRSNPQVSTPIASARTVEQLIQIIEVVHLSEFEVKKLNAASA